MSITIKDIARDAGVSIATVSHVINESKKVSEATKVKVLKSIERLGYYPNQLSGGLRSKKTYSIGLIIPSITNETFARLAETIQDILFEKGFNLIVCNTHYDAETEEKALNTLMMKRVDALIAIPSSSSSERLREIASTRPVILLDREIKDLQTDCVSVNNYYGEYMATEYLIRKGHRKIGYVDRFMQQSHSLDQLNGYKDALRDNRIEVDENLIVSAKGYYYQAGMEAAQTLMSRCRDISAVACYYDLMAFGVIRGLIDLGYRVPEDVSVIGYDNMQFTEASSPRLTTVETPYSAMAEQACRLVIERLDEQTDEDDKKKGYSKIILDPKLVIRESVKEINKGDQQ